MNVQTGTLRQDITLIRPGAHGDYYMIFDPVSESYFKISPAAAAIISKIDRSYELDAFLERLHNAGIEAEKSDVLEMIAFLQQNNLLASEYGHYERKKEQLSKLKEDTWLLRFASVYMFFKLPPIRPDRFFKWLAPYVYFLGTRYFIYTVAIPALLGYLLMLRDFSAVRATFVDSLSWAGLAKYFVAIIFLKIIHESSHAVAAMHFNCRVRAIGISFIVFYPRLFTDTTDSWLLPRRQRLLIDAAGLIGELLVGGIAALCWVYLPPGAMKSTMFYIFAVSTISTLLVNGNPLIRYDGYYILCDILNIENLMVRSGEYLKQFWRYWVFHLGARPAERRGAMLLGFGIASFFYRIFLYTSIILVIYNSFVKAVAVVLLFLEVYAVFLYPLYRELKTIRLLSRRAAARANWFWAVAVLAVTAAVLFFPLSWNITLPGEIRLEGERIITVEEGGFLDSEWPTSPRRVKAGELLFQLKSPGLEYSIERLKWSCKLYETLADVQESDRATFSDSLLTLEKLRSDQTALVELQRRQARLTHHAPADGVFVPLRYNLSPGRHFPTGIQAGTLFSGKLMVHAYADDRDVQNLRPGMEVEVLLPDQLGTASGKISLVNQIPVKLHNSPLLQHFGGPIPVYADEKNPGEYQSVMAMYRIEVALEDPPRLFAGRSVRVKVLHREVLAGRIYDLLLSVFRREF